MTRTQAAKTLGILQDRSQWWCVREADGRELLFELGKLDLKSAEFFQSALNNGTWIDLAGNLGITSAAEKAAIPQIVLRLVQSADAYFTLAGK